MSRVKLFLLSTATCLLLFPTIYGQTKPEQKPPEPPRSEPDDGHDGGRREHDDEAADRKNPEEAWTPHVNTSVRHRG